ncbi:PorV/PorQ family protein [bacterium]|nr:PorV/PorQ family protein [bacterium]MBU1633371.1 PorV/PorQ family protein [bacterium]MBU1873165.1 PorV/PorQ family protein [bacterium]
MIKKVILFLTMSFTISWAQDKVGTSAAAFLHIPVGARASAMGGAFVAIANNSTATYWNPGGLSRVKQNEFTVNHMKWLVGSEKYFISAVYKVGNGAVGVSLNQLDYGEEEITTVTNPEGTGERWGARDMAVGLSYAANLTDRFSIGGTMKYISQEIWHEHSDAYAVDVGLLFISQIKNIRIGMNIANFGGEMQMTGKDLMQPVDVDPGNAGNNENITALFQTKQWPLPLIFSVGLAADPISNAFGRWTVAVDALHPNNNNSYLNIGTEFSWKETLLLRAGYSSLFKSNAEEGLTLGFGVAQRLNNIYFGVDYSYIDMKRFDGLSKYSISIGF